MASSYRKIAKNSLIVLFANFFVLTLNFFFVFLGLRYAGLYDYGVFTLLMTFVGFGEQFITLGIFPVMVSEIARRIGQKTLGEAKSLVYRFAQAQVFFALLGAVLFASVGYFNFFNLNPLHQNALFVFALYTLFVFPKNVFLTTFEGHQRFDLIARFSIVEAIAKLLLLLFLWWSGFAAAVLGLALTSAAGIILASTTVLPSFIGIVKPWFKIPRTKVNLFFTLAKEQGIFAFFTHILKNIQINLYPWLIRLFLGVEAVAVFAVLQKIQNAVMKVVQPLDSTLLPLVSEMDKETEVRSFHNRISKYSFWISFGAFALISLAIPFFLAAYIGESFPGQEIAMMILLACLPFYSLSFPIRSVLFRHREQAFLTKLQLATILILFGSTALFTYYAGLVGAAIATLLFFASDLVIRRRFVAKKYSVDFSTRSFFSYDSTDRIFVQRIMQKIGSFFSRKKGPSQERF